MKRKTLCNGNNSNYFFWEAEVAIEITFLGEVGIVIRYIHFKSKGPNSGTEY